MKRSASMTKPNKPTSRPWRSNPKNVLVLNNLAYLMADSMGQAPQARPYAQKAY